MMAGKTNRWKYLLLGKSFQYDHYSVGHSGMLCVQITVNMKTSKVIRFENNNYVG
jgi:hypothetical protein